MRWNSPKPSVGDKKIARCFPLVPLVLNGEARWLEFCKVEYVFTSAQSGWAPLRFENQPPIESETGDWYVNREGAARPLPSMKLVQTAVSRGIRHSEELNARRLKS